MVFSFIRQQFVKTGGILVLLTSLGVTAGLVGLRHLGGLESLELDAYDRFIRLKPYEAPDERILVVGVTEEDIQGLQQYPLYDGTLAQALTNLEKYEPRAIGVDIGRDVPQGPPQGRVALKNVLASSDRIVSACLLSSTDQPGVPPAPGTPPDLTGFADFPVDVGGVIRRSILISTPVKPPVTIGKTHVCNDASPDNEVLSLSLLLSVLYLEKQGISPEQTKQQELQLSHVVFKRLEKQSGGYADTGATDYQMMLNYRGRNDAIRQVSLTDVLKNRVKPEWVHDRVVLVGYTSPVANDIVTTPYRETQAGSRGMPGVVVHAQAVSQILSAVLDRRPLIGSLPKLVEILLIGSAAILGGIVALLSRRLALFALLLGVLIGGNWLLAYGLFIQGLWLPMVPIAIALLITAISTSSLQRANQSGYTQAIYEQLRDQLQGRKASTADADYLETLVRRARAIREGRQSNDWNDTWETDLISHPSTNGLHTTDTLHFKSPQAQAVYDQIKAQAMKDLEQEQAALEAEQSRQRAESQRRQIDQLLKRAKTTRTISPPER
jgi:CHASE2 domain-containing sensor protein